MLFADAQVQSYQVSEAAQEALRVGPGQPLVGLQQAGLCLHWLISSG